MSDTKQPEFTTVELDKFATWSITNCEPLIFNKIAEIRPDIIGVSHFETLFETSRSQWPTYILLSFLDIIMKHLDDTYREQPEEELPYHDGSEEDSEDESDSEDDSEEDSEEESEELDSDLYHSSDDDCTPPNDSPQKQKDSELGDFEANC